MRPTHQVLPPRPQPWELSVSPDLALSTATPHLSCVPWVLPGGGGLPCLLGGHFQTWQAVDPGQGCPPTSTLSPPSQVHPGDRWVSSSSQAGWKEVSSWGHMPPMGTEPAPVPSASSLPSGGPGTQGFMSPNQLLPPGTTLPRLRFPGILPDILLSWPETGPLTWPQRATKPGVLSR